MRRIYLLSLAFITTLLLGACSRPSLPTAGAETSKPLPTSLLSQAGSGVSSENPTLAPSATPAPDGPAITIQAGEPARPFDRRLLGTNVPAWLGPDRLADKHFQDRTIALGAPLLRLPGGSWSNAYNWLACENGDQEACYWPWAARPTDFLNFLRATGSEGMWTVSFNSTAQEAAALVAFFNGAVDDEQPIGIDVRGVDWKTVGHWARLRAEHGNPEPLPIRLWEFGNEVYGGKAGAGAECADWGWEDVWTCDGAEYMQGSGSGADHREGYLEFRAAMRSVDPEILVGAVGVDNPQDWSNWGNEVIGIAGDNLDFYVVHRYAFSQTPPSAEAVLDQPQRIWAEVIGSLHESFDRYANGRRSPIAVTEYNLTAFQDLDNDQLMRRAVNALFVADTIGQMAEQGVVIANQWNLANGRADNGTDYGLIDAQSGERSPQYYALALWGRFGSEMLPVSSTFPADTTLSVYAGRTADGALTVLAINKTDQPLTASVRAEGADGAFAVSADTLSAGALTDTAVSFNGSANPADDLSDAPAQDLGVMAGPFDYTFGPFSITLLKLSPK
ncbi:MAG: alpha-L-arabinofuranosidase [Chloroflexales bacterium]|nr:alpha-L-arabinofuranosidase [Chloroflexales bacterium]